MSDLYWNPTISLSTTHYLERIDVTCLTFSSKKWRLLIQMMWTTLLLLPFIDSEASSTSSSDEWWLKWQIVWQTSKQRGILWMWFPWYFSTYSYKSQTCNMAEWKAKKCIHQYFFVVLIVTGTGLNFGSLTLFQHLLSFYSLIFLLLLLLQSKRRNKRQVEGRKSRIIPEYVEFYWSGTDARSLCFRP